MRQIPQVVAELIGGKMVSTGRTPINPTLANFVICCSYGDWSGSRRGSVYLGEE
jgi:hypothetical protein